MDTLGKNNDYYPYPCTSFIREATEKEKQELNIKGFIEGKQELIIGKSALVKVYQRLHQWAHEINPYSSKINHDEFNTKNAQILKNDIDSIWAFIQKHTISINRQMFYAVLKDDIDNMVKVVSLTKESDLPENFH